MKNKKTIFSTTGIVFFLTALCATVLSACYLEDIDALREKVRAGGYIVTFDANGATGGTAPSLVRVDIGSSMTLPAQGSLFRNAYVFTGWMTRLDGTGTAYAAGEYYTPSRNVTLYAKWVPRGTIFTVAFNVNGATSGIAPSSEQVDAGSSISLPAQGFLYRTGYTFAGWNTRADGAGTGYNERASYTPPDNVTLYAWWNPIRVSGVSLNRTVLAYSMPFSGATETVALIANVNPVNAADTSVSWSTSNASVATVNNGVVTIYPVSGVATITITTADGGFTAQCMISVYSADMVWIHPGTFLMGSPEDEPGRSNGEIQHQVTLTQGFYMGKNPVTQDQYQSVMGTNPSSFTTLSGGDNPAKRPVECVSWYDAIVFCNRLSTQEGLTPAYSINNSTNPADWGSIPVNSNNATWDAVTIVSGSTGYRLPTEAQWEYACHAGTTTAFNWWINYIDSSEANYDARYVDAINTIAGMYLGRTIEVGSYAPNAWGLHDMHGNVQEWCWDWYGTYSGGAQTDPTGAASGNSRVIRGGSWSTNGQGVRSACRGIIIPFYRFNYFGFRLVRP